MAIDTAVLVTLRLAQSSAIRVAASCIAATNAFLVFARVPRHTGYEAISVWADSEESILPFATETSRDAKTVLLTAVEHADVYGWQLFEGGKLLREQWTETGEHDILAKGLSEIGVRLKPDPMLPERLTYPNRCICVNSGTTWARPFEKLSKAKAILVVEQDLPDIGLQSLLPFSAERTTPEP
jgi:hypothetical protein